MSSQGHVTNSKLRTPRAAAIAGILFAVLLGTALVLVTLSIPSVGSRANSWFTDPHRRGAVAVALNLVPFAGIAFLWFIGVVRDRLGEREDKFFASVFLGSGLLFVAMLFVAAAIGGGLIASIDSGGAAIAAANSTAGAQRQITWIVLHIYTMRMAAVFTMSTAVIALRTGFAPRWIAGLGIAVAVILLISVGLSPWVELLFPAWIFIVSVDILFRATGAGSASQGTT